MDTITITALALAITTLPPCPSSPNCVSTEAVDDGHRVEPLALDVAPEIAVARLRRALASLPRTRIVADDGTHLRAEATSLLFRFVDDIDVVVDAAAHTIRMRSASRVGHSDLGANRRRLERLRAAYAAAIP